MLTIEWKGLENVRANLRALAEKFPEELGGAMRTEGEAIIEDGNVHCPFDQDNPHDDGTPHLNETGQVEGPAFEEGDIIIKMSYGEGIDSIYPILQHEVQEYHHDQPETWKWLEHAMTDRTKVLASNLIRGVSLEKAMK